MTNNGVFFENSFLISFISFCKIKINFSFYFSPKNAIAAIKKKMLSTNPHTAEYACCVLESVVKNCGMYI